MMLKSEVFVRGAGRYVDDIHFPNMLYMAVSRSPYSRARIISLSGGINYRDLDVHMASGGEGGGGDFDKSILQPVFAKDYVNHIGQPVAAVFADTREAAEDKLEEIDAKYEKLKPILTIDQALSQEPIHTGSKSNLIMQRWMGIEFEDPDAPIVLEDELATNRVIVNPMETRGVIADYDGSRLTIWISTQSVYSIKGGLSKILGIDYSKIRVVQADTGGGFGVKGGVNPEYVMAAYAAMKYKRPVKWIETRREHLSSSQHGRGVRAKMRLFAEKSGRIVGLKGEVTVDAGAFAGTMGSIAQMFITRQLTGPYGIENAHILASSVMTNKPPQGPYRGAGRPEAAFFMERMVDLLAGEIGKEDDEVRLINTTSESFTSPLGMRIDPSRPFFEKALKDLKYKERSKDYGLGFFVLVPALMPGESARIRVQDGKVDAWLGGNVHGQAHEIFVKRLIKEELGVPEEKQH
jgi:carbon-monoxide dehydrogenase large subunit